MSGMQPVPSMISVEEVKARLSQAIDDCKYSCAANMSKRMETLMKVGRDALRVIEQQALEFDAA